MIKKKRSGYGTNATGYKVWSHVVKQLADLSVNDGKMPDAQTMKRTAWIALGYNLNVGSARNFCSCCIDNAERYSGELVCGDCLAVDLWTGGKAKKGDFVQSAICQYGKESPYRALFTSDGKSAAEALPHAVKIMEWFREHQEEAAPAPPQPWPYPVWNPIANDPNLRYLRLITNSAGDPNLIICDHDGHKVERGSILSITKYAMKVWGRLLLEDQSTTVPRDKEHGAILLEVG